MLLFSWFLVKKWLARVSHLIFSTSFRSNRKLKILLSIVSMVPIMSSLTGTIQDIYRDQVEIIARTPLRSCTSKPPSRSYRMDISARRLGWEWLLNCKCHRVKLVISRRNATSFIWRTISERWRPNMSLDLCIHWATVSSRNFAENL